MMFAALGTVHFFYGVHGCFPCSRRDVLLGYCLVLIVYAHLMCTRGLRVDSHHGAMRCHASLPVPLVRSGVSVPV